MTREPLIEVRVVRRPQFQHGTVFAQLAFKKKTRLALHRLQEFGIGLRKERWIDRIPVALVEQKPRFQEIRYKADGPRIAQHANHLTVEDGGIAQVAGASIFEQGSI